MNGVSRQVTSNFSYPINKGYIIVPKNTSRDSFIQDCYRREKVSILVEDGGGVVHNCYISRNAIAEVSFPLEHNEIGSAVIFVSEPFTDFPIIIAVISKENETQLLEENLFKIVKSLDNNSVSILGAGKTGKLLINVKGDEGGKIYVNLLGEDSEFNLSSIGTVSLYSDKEFNIISSDSFTVLVKDVDNEKQISFKIDKKSGVIYSDSFGNGFTIDDSGNINFTPNNKFSLFTGGEPMVLGDKTVDSLQDIISELSSVAQDLATFSATQVAAALLIPVIAGMIPGYTTLGTSMATIIIKLQRLNVKVEKIISNKSYLD